MRRLIIHALAISIICGAAFTTTARASNEIEAGGLNLTAKVFTSGGWVRPGESYPLILLYKTGAAPVASATLSVTLHTASVFQQSTPPAAPGGNGTAALPLVYTLGPLLANANGKIIIEARAKNLVEDPTIIWKDISARVTMTVAPSPAVVARTHGPKVTTLASARFGDRPFPVVMVQYQDFKHCTGVDTPYPGCTGNHTAEALSEAVNSKTSGKSLWQLYQDMSFGQLYPIGTVAPPPNTGTKAFTAGYNHKFSTLSPGGVCSGTTLAAVHGTPAYPNRVEDGWYLLPGTQGYYGSDAGGQALVSGSVPVAQVSGIDDGCGPTGKIVYDAASLADPDIDYNELDTDKDGVVDFFNLMFAGCGGHGCADITGPNNIWPHKSDLQYYYEDTNGLTGYVSNDQLKNHYDQPLYYTNASRVAWSTTVTAFPVYVRVGPYNVNPEDAVEQVSVVAHEYGHSLGLPDFYSNSYEAMGSWELMGSDYFQYMTVFSRQYLGWIVPRPLETGTVTLRDSKFDTGEIHWRRPDGTKYTLTGEGIHNADAYRLGLPTEILIDEVPSGVRAWFSGAGNNFGCVPTGGHNFDVFLPDMKNTASAAAVTLKFKSLFGMEWDWDYGFVMVSDDGGATWTTLPSQNGTTIENTYNPNNAGCFRRHNNGITGVSGGGANTIVNPNRIQGLYPDPVFVDDQFDLSAYKGKSIILRFSYFTDANTIEKGWFIDDIEIKADTNVVYASDFEAGPEDTRLSTKGWSRVSTTDGVDTDHAYYLELRSRTGNDFDGKLQSGRGVPGWEGGVSVIYSDVNHAFGNTSAPDHPGQTPVDAIPDPGNSSPNLNDAAFTLERPHFNGCTHIDNYEDPNGPDGNWKLPPFLKFTVTGLTGLTESAEVPAVPAVATLVAEVFPNCDLTFAAPVLSIASGYENPDTDGAFTLAWTRPVGALGPEMLQESSSCSPSFTDLATAPLILGANAIWSGSPQWTTQLNPSDASTAYYVPAGASQDESLTMLGTVAIPAGFSSTLTFTTYQGLEAGFDFGYVEVSADGGPFVTLASYSGPDALDPLTVFEGMRTVDLSEFSGKSIKLRFRIESDAFNIGQQAGWYIDNIKITNSDWTEVPSGDVLTRSFTGHPVGDFCYRVRTIYPVGGTTLNSPFSNVVNVSVASTIIVPTITPSAVCQGGPAFTLTFDAAGFVAGSTVQIDGVARQTTFVNSTRVRAVIPASDVLSAGTRTVRVVNPDNTIIGPATLTVTADTTSPVVTAPPSMSVMQSMCATNGSGGATSGTAPSLASYLAASSGIDDCSGTATRLAPQVAGADVNDSTVFPAGPTTVAFRYRDNAGNTGQSTSTVTVRLYADLDVDRVVNSTDAVILANYLVDNVTPGTAPFIADGPTADVNRDGVIDAVDFVIVLNYLVDNISCMPTN